MIKVSFQINRERMDHSTNGNGTTDPTGNKLDLQITVSKPNS